MKEAFGLSYIWYLILTFLSIIIMLIAGSLAYSKTFRIKNRIIEIIEDNDGYNTAARTQIDNALESIGYKVNPRGVQECPIYKGQTAINNLRTNYRYCVYKFDTGVKGSYYAISAFMYIDIPIAGDLEYPIYGETNLDYDI